MAKDAIHDSIKNALIKDGWTITAEFLQVEYEELEIFADLVAEREPIVAEKQGKKIIVEVKTFAGRSFIRALQQALGQYDLYVDIIALAKLDYDLYLAVSSVIYETFFLRKGTHEVVQRRQLKLLVVDVEREEVVQWIE
jgi:predicted RecB family endonuclease